MVEEKRGRGRPRSDVQRRKITIALREEWVEELDRMADLRERGMFGIRAKTGHKAH